MRDDATPGPRSRLLPALAGPFLFALACIVPLPASVPEAAARTAGIVAWMATWWVTEVVPLPVTALLPLVLFPGARVLTAGQVAPAYANPFVFLMAGGFFLAQAMQRHDLHRRVALWIVATVGGGPRRLVLGFMIAAAFLSLWLSNTATAAMLYPIGLAVATRVRAPGFTAAVMLGTAYACNIGGMGTLVGTFPNVVFAGMAPELLPGRPAPDFLGWMILAVPLVAILVPLAWVVLTRVTYRQPPAAGDGAGLTAVRDELRSLGRMSSAESRTAVVFLVATFLWITRRGLDAGGLSLPGWAALLGVESWVHDSTVAMAAAVALFVVPAGRKNGARGGPLLGPDALPAIPWPILILFGGGFALATGFTSSGLGDVLGGALAGLGQVPLPVALLVVSLGVSFLTEINSNTATTTTLLPLVAAAAPALGLPAYPLLLAVTFSASCAFMLPTATPPNAIVFASGSLRLHEMARAGVLMNTLAALVISALCALLGALQG